MIDMIDLLWESKEIWLREFASLLPSTSCSHFYRNYSRFWMCRFDESTHVFIRRVVVYLI
jgi:hypothetical protein